MWLRKVMGDPYYFDAFPASNATKGILGESEFATPISDFYILHNITYGHRQKDIDHLVLTSECIVFNESKNTKEDFEVSLSWFLSHILNRFVDGLPIAQWYARTLGYFKIKLTLTITRLNTSPLIHSILKHLGIQIIETGKQLTEIYQFREKALNQWAPKLRRKILSVLTPIHNCKIARTAELVDGTHAQKPTIPRMHLAAGNDETNESLLLKRVFLRLFC